MQAKGIVRFFFILIALVCIYQFLLILPTRKVERAADRYAENVSMGIQDAKEKASVAKQARVSYLDSMSTEKIFSIPLFRDFTYQELKGQQLALGLDLKGGLSTVLQVDLKDLLISLAKDSKDPTFRKALVNADERLKNTQSDYITVFGQEFAKIADGKKLSTIFARNAALADFINFESSDAEVLTHLRKKGDETVSLTFNRLKDRIDKFGVTQPNVTLDEGRDMILVELPGVDNPERARNYLQAEAKLEFWDVYQISDPGVFQAFVTADTKLKNELAGDSLAVAEPEMVKDTIYEAVLDSLGNATGDSTMSIVDVPNENNPFAQGGPLLKNFALNSPNSTYRAMLGEASKNKMNLISKYLAREDIKKLFPKDMIFKWASKASKNFETGELSNNYILYGLKMPKGGVKSILSGEDVTDARANPDPNTGEVGVTLRMDNRGAKKWADMTTKAAADGNRGIAIVLDEEVVSAPNVQNAITDGVSSITGNFTIQEGNDLANILQVGKLPAKTKIIQESLVGPTLGKENIRKSVMSLVLGFLLVLVFMIIYYSTSGIVAILALLCNVFFIFGALASFGTVLTLPGIAGIVLTIGMAVDANVIIFERIREELRAGKGLMAAINAGYKHSNSAIIDANVTTLLVAMILAYFGLGPIKGFAVVLIIGVIFSLFTAVLLSRLMIDWWVSKKGRSLKFWNSYSKNTLVGLNIDWLGMRKKSYLISGAIILLGIIAFFTRGFDLGVDFKGGYSYNVAFPEEVSVSNDALRKGLSDVFGSAPVVKSVDGRNTYNITTDYLINSTDDAASDQVLRKLHEGVQAITGTQINYDSFSTPGSDGPHIETVSKVGPTIADDIKSSSWKATIFSLLLIFLYILFRFNKWQYSAGAVMALIHDTAILLSVFAMGWGFLGFSMEIDQAFIAALLTVIGYSMNDTVVVFDRIREFLNTYTKKSRYELINEAISTTMSRTVITSVTTFIVVFILWLFGGSSIKGFAFAILIGVIVGTYSSIFIATPVYYDLSRNTDDKVLDK